MLTVQLNPINDADESSGDDEDHGLGREMAEYSELEYFCQAS